MNQEMPKAGAENPEITRRKAIQEAIQNDAELTTLSAAISTSMAVGDTAMAKGVINQLRDKLKMKTGLELPKSELEN